MAGHRKSRTASSPSGDSERSGRLLIPGLPPPPQTIAAATQNDQRPDRPGPGIHGLGNGIPGMQPRRICRQSLPVTGIGHGMCIWGLNGLQWVRMPWSSGNLGQSCSGRTRDLYNFLLAGRPRRSFRGHTADRASGDRRMRSRSVDCWDVDSHRWRDRGGR